MREQAGIRKGTFHRKYFLGAHPIIQFYIEKLRIPEIISAHIKQDARVVIGCEKMIPLIIHNTLTSPKPMYELHDWADSIDEESVGFEHGELKSVNDDRAAKTLDRFYFGKHKDVFFHISLRAIKVFDIDCSRMHQDTSTVTFCGRYDGWTAKELLAHGKNKDHRPDLKQLVLGMSVAADGSVPLCHQVYDGNKTDDRVHVENHNRLRKLLQRADFIYVADCKLATAENLKKITAFGGRFISVMPRTWKEDGQFRKKVQGGQVEWKYLLSRQNNRKPNSKLDRYYIAQGEYSTSAGYCLLWIKSSQKAEQDAETRSRNINEGMDELRSLQTRLNKYNLKARSNIKKAIDKLLKEKKCKKYISVKIHRHRESKTKHTGKGRPKACAKGTRTWTVFYAISFSVDKDALNVAAMDDGVFPIITNVHNDYAPKKILEMYKFQPFLEKRNSQLKTWQEIAPLYVKKGERAVALIHVNVMSLMVATTIERQLRLGMKSNGIASLPIYPEGIPCKYPTLYDIVRLFNNIERYEVEKDGEVMLFPAHLSDLQRKILQLLEVPESLYH